MESSTLYLRWRPQSLSEVVGQEHITHTLRNALRSGRISHAYLFCGPRGTGKTSAGRILAKAVNCLENKGKDEPCNRCSMCQSITEGRAMDIIEIDAASNRGIDDIRELREKAGFAPNVARRKVYIVDEVHMLTPHASNALLKTLEEPPPYVMFILATTEPHQLLPTIVSRCQRHDFHRLSIASVVKRLEQICQKEGFSIEEEVLRLIARNATGSLRDAENILERLIAYYGNTVTLEQSRHVLGSSSESQVREIVKYIVASDIQGGINFINRISQEGTDLNQLHRGLMDYIRDMLFIRIGAEQSVDATKEEKQDMKKLAGSVTPEFLFRALKVLGEKDLKIDSYSTLPIELALMEICLPSETRGQTPGYREQITEYPGKAQPEQSAGPSHGREPFQRPKAQVAGQGLHTSDTGSPVSDKPVLGQTQDETKAQGALKPPDVLPSSNVQQPQMISSTQGASRDQKAGADSKSNVSDSVRESTSKETPAATELGEIQRRWRDFNNSLRGMGSQGALDALLRHACSPESLENDVITLVFNNNFTKEKVADPKYGYLVEKGLLAFFGKPYKINCMLKSQDKSAVRAGGKGDLVRAALEEMGAVKIKREE